MADQTNPKQIRAFYVTGVQVEIGQASSTTNLIGQSDTDSNTSGYLSSSSFESTGEERRLVLNEQKVFQLWEKLGQHVHVQRNSAAKQSEDSVCRKTFSMKLRDDSSRKFTSKLSEETLYPRNSTPKQQVHNGHKKRVKISTESGRSLLSIKRNLGNSGLHKQSTKQNSPSYIETTNTYKSKYENELRKQCQERYAKADISHVKSDSCIGTASQCAIKHDSGTAIDDVRCRRVKTSTSNEWKRKPFLTLSNIASDLLSTDNISKCSTNFSNYNSLPRYRVTVDGNTKATKSNLAKKLNKSCADFSEEGLPVDESMTEFLSNVDQNNLASLLNFYDRVTSGPGYEKARRYYEAVYH